VKSRYRWTLRPEVEAVPVVGVVAQVAEEETMARAVEEEVVRLHQRLGAG